MSQDINPLAKAELDRLSKMDFDESEGGGGQSPLERFNQSKQDAQKRMEEENKNKAQDFYMRMNQPEQSTVLSEGTEDRFGEAKQNEQAGREAQQRGAQIRATGQGSRKI